MMINATLLVQLLNFLIAYTLIDRFLLRRCVAMVEDERHSEEALRNSIALEKTQLLRQEDLKKSMWQQCQSFFAKNIPSIIQAKRPHIKHSQEKYEVILLSQIDEKKHIDMLKNFIYKKVSNVR